MTKILVNKTWYIVQRQETIGGTIHFWISARDDGGNPYAGWLPFWLVEDIEGPE